MPSKPISKVSIHELCDYENRPDGTGGIQDTGGKPLQSANMPKSWLFPAGPLVAGRPVRRPAPGKGRSSEEWEAHDACRMRRATDVDREGRPHGRDPLLDGGEGDPPPPPRGPRGAPPPPHRGG